MMPILKDLVPVVDGSAAVAILSKVTIVLAVALVAARLARKSSAAIRHGVLAAAFAVLLVLPIASAVVPTIPVAFTVAVPESVGSNPLREIPSDALPASQVNVG